MYYTERFDQLGNDTNIIAEVYGDVNGDNIRDYVYLTGTRTPNSGYIQNITLVIRDGRTGIKQRARLKSDSGYSPTVTLQDFTGDKIKDIMIGIASGGSGGIMFYYVFSDVNNQLTQLFDYEEYNQRYSYKVEFADYYKVNVTNVEKNVVFVIDITYKGKEYLDEIYTPEGILKQPIEGWVDPLGGLYPIDFDGNGVYELLGYQSIAGRYHADSLGYVQSVLKWNGRKFYLMEQYVGVFGGSPE
ncbi:hypothetical protein [Ruminiclostridium cellobioparum]|uniref:FG-GAP repeat protein n=1 Tax=Ruminiclostridium cellobioparum subsp. termitidis CT1112 TaxID=1195236 RepID=S0FGW8_RUMCE|nr:hypothetical protein [Ruminiclostridium cellobioparum]EMS70830.1 hypothetical protein CTER_3455 [Ruminiclostridium cellobioparum subsp. termitidis CT1112]